ncbi:MAG: hypothetical protein EVJ46_05355 [Candidatus Acididesulfobacter guangdongensis]|uniref:Sulfotransferase domain-containing protein n=1 Tax=Acididesulfobacter guangdongensis TaxID=2597225 RepID=A0A519BGP6_ACIG2|nr:MAG: hypothetical protein EVJ46_05355 [Candidatus Acididesulfobacter guangdongensis]
MRKKIFLHIGTHKTGTTALQSTLSVNYKYLKKKGILYPSAGKFGKFGGHHNIIAQLNNDMQNFKKKYGTLEDLCSEIKRTNFPVVIISSENFQCLYSKPDKLQILKNCFERCGYSTEVIIFLREQIPYMIELYRELLKYGLDISFEEYTKEILDSGKFILNPTKKFSETFSFIYEDTIKSFADVFGEKNINCMQYAFPIEPIFFKATGLSNLYENLKPVTRADLTNKPLPFIKALALEYYNNKTSKNEIRDKVKQIGRNHIISWPLPSLYSIDNHIEPYICRIKTEFFFEKFTGSNIRLNANYGLKLPINNEYYASPKTQQTSKYDCYRDYSVSVETLANKAIGISKLPLIAGKALRKFYKFLNPLKRILYKFADYEYNKRT